MPAHRASYEDALHQLFELGSTEVRNVILERNDDAARLRAEQIEREADCNTAELVAAVWRKPVWMVLLDARRLHMKRAA
jgi:hypothetical protein